MESAVVVLVWALLTLGGPLTAGLPDGSTAVALLDRDGEVVLVVLPPARGEA